MHTKAKVIRTNNCWSVSDHAVVDRGGVVRHCWHHSGVVHNRSSNSFEANKKCPVSLEIKPLQEFSFSI